MSGTSQWPTSEPKIARSGRPPGSEAVSKAWWTSGSSASQPKKKFGTKRFGMSSSVASPQAANSSTVGAARSFEPKASWWMSGPEDAIAASFAPWRSKSCVPDPAIEARGVVVLDRDGIALLEVADEIVQQTRGPGGAAFEERQAKLREAIRDAAQEERAAERFGGRREEAEMVEHVVRGRAVAVPADGAGVGGGRDAEVEAALPEGIVVVERIESEAVDPGRLERNLAAELLDRSDGPAHEARDQRCLEAELLHGVLELVDRLLRRLHRDHGDRREPSLGALEDVGVELVQRPAATRGAGGRRGCRGSGGPIDGIDDAEIEPELLHPLGHQASACWRSRSRGYCAPGRPTRKAAPRGGAGVPRARARPTCPCPDRRSARRSSSGRRRRRPSGSRGSGPGGIRRYARRRRGSDDRGRRGSSARIRSSCSRSPVSGMNGLANRRLGAEAGRSGRRSIVTHTFSTAPRRTSMLLDRTGRDRFRHRPRDGPRHLPSSGARGRGHRDGRPQPREPRVGRQGGRGPRPPRRLARDGPDRQGRRQAPRRQGGRASSAASTSSSTTPSIPAP